jgi:hypothetical protein
LTWEDGAIGKRTLRLRPEALKIIDRDADVLRVISRFNMLTSNQIDRICFRASASRTSMRNTMRRLLAQKLVVRIEHRVPGGARGGSGQYVYRLSSLGWKMLRTGAYPVRRTVDYHTLAIADVYIALLDAQESEEAGKAWLRVHYLEIEDEAYRKIEGYAIRPDMYLELDNLRRGTRRHFAIEVDMGTENRPVILDKVNRYRHAKMHNRSTYKVFPDVIFLVNDTDRAEQLKRWVGHSLTIEGDRVFYFGLLSDFPWSLQ